MFETPARALYPTVYALPFRIFAFDVLTLFRISYFVLRDYGTLVEDQRAALGRLDDHVEFDRGVEGQLGGADGAAGV